MTVGVAASRHSPPLVVLPAQGRLRALKFGASHWPQSIHARQKVHVHVRIRREMPKV